MTPKERVDTAIAGREVDQKPTLGWPETGNSDIEVRLAKENFTTDAVHLVQISNPFGLALSRGVNLAEILRADVAEGEKALEDTASEVKATIDEALASGADGVLYVLHGANPSLSTPMEYGGHFLEVDRELLSAAGDHRVVFVVGGEGTFLDFVSDIPAEVFAWDVAGTGVTASQLREMRKGALATTEADSDILLTHSGDISPTIQKHQLVNV